MCIDNGPSSDLEASDLGEMERDWLHLLRLICASYEHNRADGWDRAISHAEMRYGADNGPAIAAHVTGIIRAMRAERFGGFSYLSPYCPSCRQRVTEDEWHLIALFQAGYRGRRAEIAEMAAAFAHRSEEAPALAAAAARFGSALAAAVGFLRPQSAQNLMLH